MSIILAVLVDVHPYEQMNIHKAQSFSDGTNNLTGVGQFIHIADFNCDEITKFTSTKLFIILMMADLERVHLALQIQAITTARRLPQWLQETVLVMEIPQAKSN